METASFQGLIDVILFIIIFYYAMKFLARLFLPVLAKKAVEKAAEQFQQQHQNYQNQQNQYSNQNQATEKPKEKKIVGEYVDFEEIE
jgi:biopolymer transport protein ExbD